MGKIRQCSPHVPFALPFHLMRDGRPQFGAIASQHSIASRGTNINRPRSRLFPIRQKRTRTGRDQLQANWRQRRAQHTIAKINCLGGSTKLCGKSPGLPRCRKQLETGAGNDRQRTLAADQEFHQVVAGNILHHTAAAFGLTPVAGYKSDPNAVVAQSAVTVAQRTRHRGGQQSADGRAFWQCRIASEE